MSRKCEPAARPARKL